MYTLLESGQKVLIGQAKDVLDHMKKIKALDWKVSANNVLHSRNINGILNEN